MNARLYCFSLSIPTPPRVRQRFYKGVLDCYSKRFGKFQQYEKLVSILGGFLPLVKRKRVTESSQFCWTIQRETAKNRLILLRSE